METLRERLLSALDDSLLDRVEPMIAEAELPAELVEPVRAYTAAKIEALREFANALSEPEDEDELYRSTAYWWLELKNEWVRFNQVTQYRLIRFGETTPMLFAKGAVCQEVLGRVEQVILPRDLATLNDLWSEPLVVGRRDLAQLRTFLDHHKASVARIDHLMVSAADTYAHLAQMADRAVVPESRDEVKSLLGRYERELASLHDDMQQILSVDLAVAWRDIEARVYAESESAGVRAQVLAPGASFGLDARVLPDVADLTVAAARVLLACAESAEARMAANKTAHSSLFCDVSERERDLVIEVRDTGSGDIDKRIAAGEPVTEAWQALQQRAARVGAVVGLACVPGESNAVTVTLPQHRAGKVDELIAVETSGRRTFVRSAWVRSIHGGDAPEGAIDLRSDASVPGVVLDVALPSGAVVAARIDRAGPQVRTLVLPATAAEEPSFLAYDAAVFVGGAFVPVLGERNLLAGAAANESDAALVA